MNKELNKLQKKYDRAIKKVHALAGKSVLESTWQKTLNAAIAAKKRLKITKASA